MNERRQDISALTLVRDTLAQLDAMDIQTGNYLCGPMDGEVMAAVAKKECRTCAMGALWLNSLLPDAVVDLDDSDFDPIVDGAAEILGGCNAHLIETAFEGMEIQDRPIGVTAADVEKAVTFGNMFDDPKERLRAILEVAAQNFGTFDPPDLNHTEMVEDFMRLAKQPLPHWPKLPDAGIRQGRANLIWEEVGCEALSLGLGCDFEVTINGATTTVPASCIKPKVVRGGDMVELVDGCLDGKVVLTGTLLASGIGDIDRYQRVVDWNNLQKFGPGHSFREDGKLVKPPGHRGPNITSMLINDQWEGK